MQKNEESCRRRWPATLRFILRAKTALMLSSKCWLPATGPFSKEMRSAFYISWRKYFNVSGMRKRLSVSRMEDPSALTGFGERSPPRDLVHASQFLQAHLKAACGRRFCTTSKGYVGLAQPGVRLGNTVVVLHGGKTAYLLQKVRSKGHRFVGECYIHGLMNGEALTKTIPQQVFQIL